MIEEKKATIDVQALQETLATRGALAPQAIPAFVDSSTASAPIVLSQAPPISPSDAPPVVDKPSSVVAPSLGGKN